MGESAAETVEEIEILRERLDGHVRELDQRLPAPASWTKRVVGVVVGGGAAGAISWFVMRRIRSSRTSKPPARQMWAIVQPLPEGVGRKLADAFEEGRGRPVAATALGLWILFRLAELRQLRRIRRSFRSSEARL